MGTANFSKVNAQNYYVVSQEDEFDDWVYDDAVDNIRHALRESKFEFDFNDGQKDWDDLGTLTSRFMYDDNDFQVDLVLKLRSGYYAGANFDYDIVPSTNWDSFDLEDLDRLNEILEYQYDYDIDVAKIIAPLVKAVFEEHIEKLTDVMENVLKENTEVYGLTARFSNGEAIYSKVV